MLEGSRAPCGYIRTVKMKKKNETVNTMCLFVNDKQERHEQAHGVVTTNSYYYLLLINYLCNQWPLIIVIYILLTICSIKTNWVILAKSVSGARKNLKIPT